jgi:hypothetical protein
MLKLLLKVLEVHYEKNDARLAFPDRTPPITAP